jgi:VCBS repeat-containing protein
MVDLSTYVRVGRYDLPTPSNTTPPAGSQLAEEASAVAYNTDTNTLFIVGDEGTSIVQVSLTGQLIDSMSLASGAFDDTEGLTYIGGGQFVMTEERSRNLVLFTYDGGGTLIRSETQIVNFGSNVGNVGFEGVSYDPTTGDYIIVKETDPISILLGDGTFGSTPSSGTTSGLFGPGFDPATLGVRDLADVYALSNFDAGDGNVLLISQESAQILEVTRDGVVVSRLDIYADPTDTLPVEGQNHEGITMGPDGRIYVVSENGTNSQLWVYESSSATNTAPTAVDLVNEVASIDENLNTAGRIKIAALALTDDGLGTNNYTLGGADAAFFEVDHTGVYLRVGTSVDFETKSSYSFTVNVDDPNVGGSVDASVSYTLNVNDLSEGGGGGTTGVYISEVAAFSSGNSPVGADWFEVTNGGSTAVDITGWRVDDSNPSFATAIALSGITSIAAGESVIFLEAAAGASAATVTAFLDTWFNGVAPAGLQIGTYTGSGIGLSTGGDQVNLFNSAGELEANVIFGTSPGGPTFATFNNAAGLEGTITQLSHVGQNGGFTASDSPNEIGSPGTVGKLFISEVAPWSSGTSIGADWFELTNDTGMAIDLTGWKMDDDSHNPANAVALSGITSIAAGESVIFFETADLSATVTAFVNTWFGGTAPEGLRFGSYNGSGVGLGSGGDQVNLYDADNVLGTSVAFGASGSDKTTFDNSAGLDGTGTPITDRSTVGTGDPAFAAVNDPTQIGSPGEADVINNAPVATDDALSAFTVSGSRTISFASLTANDNVGAPNDAGQTLTITGVSNAVGGTATISGTDIIFTPTAGFNGTASFDYVVRDNGTSYGADDFKSDTGSVSFTVTPVADAPAFTSGATFSAAENQTAVGTVTATDPQSDPITFSIVGGADQSLFTINASTGVVSFVNAPNFEAPADANHDNAYLFDVQASDGTHTTTQSLTVNVTNVAEQEAIYITEVSPWSSGGGSPYGADWFELTNRGTTAIDLTGWKVDDDSASFASALVLSGITSIAAGESVIFIESATPSTTIAAFSTAWFGSSTLPTGLQVGTYTGGGIGLGGGGDAVNIYDASGTLQANVTFGASTTGQTFNNAAGVNGAISTLSQVDVNGAARGIGDTSEIGSPGTTGKLFISEVAAFSSSTAVGADWFEVTNTTASAIDITGWKVDDSSASFGSALALNGITSIAAGESVIFLESANPAETIAAFIDTWFGGTAPSGLHFGTYTGSGIGLSTGGDGVNLYNASGVLQASVSFGTSPTSPLGTFDNGAGINGGTISTISSVGTNLAFAAPGDATQIGSPGRVTSNDAPVTFNDSNAVNEDASVTGNILTNDIDAQATDTLTVSRVGEQTISGATAIVGQYGTLTINPNGSYSYAADGDRADALADGEQRTDSFTYTASDGRGGNTTATLSIQVTAIADSVVTTFTPMQTVYDGNDDDEEIVGNDNGNAIDGGGGADVISGGTGEDTLGGGAGDDSLVAGAGHDWLFGGAMSSGGSEGGNDTLIAGDGADHIYGNGAGAGAGNVADGDDSIEGGAGADYINGNGGNDTIAGGADGDRLFGGRGNDSLSGDDGTDQLNGNLGDDTLSGGAGNDQIRGGEGNDLLRGDGGNDVLFGDLGNDTLVAGAGIDVMTGGGGADRFDLSGVGAGNIDVEDFYTAIADFEQGVDQIHLAFTVATGQVLQAGTFRNIGAAQDSAQQMLIDHAGTQDVAVARVGTTAYLFYNAAGTGDQITGVVALFNTTAVSIDQTDFI